MAEATATTAFKSVSDIDTEIARLENLRKEVEQAERAKALRDNHKKASDMIVKLLEDIRELERIGYLPPKLLAALSDGQGKFNPGMYIKRPKPLG